MRIRVILFIISLVLAWSSGLADQAPLRPTSPVGPPPVGPSSNVVARVVTVRDPGAIRVFEPQADRVDAMVKAGLLAFTQRTTTAAAWRTLVTPGDRVGIKVYATLGRLTGTRPAVVRAVVQGLLESGVPGNHIIVWDRHLSDLERAGFGDLARQLGVRVAGSADEGYDNDLYYEAPVLGRLIWGDHEFDRSPEKVSRKSHLSRLVTRDMTRIVNIAPALNHNLLGVRGQVANLALSCADNLLRFEHSGTLLADAVPEIYALKEIGDRVALNITDALICQFEGEDRPHLDYAVSLGEIRFSKDALALDALSFRDVERFRLPRSPQDVRVIERFFENAGLLELGISDLHQIREEVVRP